MIYRPVTAFRLRVKVGEDWVNYPVTSLKVKNAMNVGWTWEAELPQALGSTTFARKTEWRIDMVDGLGGHITTPALVALPRESKDAKSSDGGGSAKLSGTCLASHNLARRNFSLPTFRSTKAKATIAVLAEAANVTIKIPNTMPDFDVPDEDVKQAQLAEAFERFLKISAAEWYVDLLGEIRVVEWGKLGGQLELDWCNRTRRSDPENRYTKLNIGKRSAFLGNGTSGSGEYAFTDAGFKSFELQAPISNVIVSDRSSLGYVDWVGLWQGDPNTTGRLIQFFEFRSAFVNTQMATTGVWPATHMTCVCFPSSGIAGLVGLDPTAGAWMVKVIGSAPTDLPPGVDAEFFYEYDAGLDDVWPADDWIDSLFPNRAWAVARAEKYLAILNKGWDTLALDGPLDVLTSLMQWHKPNPASDNKFKVDSITWSHGLDAPETELELVLHE